VLETLAGRTNEADRPSGFALVELMVVVALIAIVTGVAIPISAGMISRAKADSTILEARSWLEEPRNRANAERRNFEVTFNTTTNHIKVQRVEPNLSRTLILDRELSGGLKFMTSPGAADTPDLFGNGTAVEFDGPAPHMFTSDGSFTDANGDPSNGTIFMGKTGQAEASRAITVFGVTGLLRTWRLVGNQWK
jgi:prepilin-type N-terminal cleavage/methylation domain-containing protein